MAAAFGWGTLAASSLLIGGVAAIRLRIGLRANGGKLVGVVTTLGFVVAFTVHQLD